MRNAVARAVRDLCGVEPEHMFSGWGGSPTAIERDAIDHMERGRVR